MIFDFGILLFGKKWNWPCFLATKSTNEFLCALKFLRTKVNLQKKNRKMLKKTKNNKLQKISFTWSYLFF